MEAFWLVLGERLWNCSRPESHYRHSSERRIRLALLRNMDLMTLFAWRTCSRRNYIEAADELRESLRLLLADFVPSPASLLSLVTRERALISGLFAIRYMLRDESLVVDCLDIYVGSVQFHSFIDDFADDQSLSGYQTSCTLLTHRDRYAYTRQTTHCLEVRLSSGKIINIHASATASACHAIACSPSSLGTSFVTEFCIATAYPRLTLQRRGIICLDRLSESRKSELDVYERLEEHGFRFQEDPTAWPDYSDGAGNSQGFGCLRARYLCPQQGRYFGDGGSMVVIMDRFSMGLAELKARNLPPYGFMAAWRMASSVLCEEQCDELDDVIGRDVLTTSVMFEDDLFTSQFPRTYADMIPDGFWSNTGTRRRGRALTM